MATASREIVAQAPDEARGGTNPIMLPTSDIVWVQVRPGQSSSVLWGDPRTGPYGRFNKFAAGFDDRPHYHTRDVRAVVVSGTFTLQVLGGERRELAPGSYVFLPGRTPHTHSCKAGADCVLFVQQDGANDAIPLETPRQ
jgi:glyoxylate utilization-related uncharacterized protein